MKMGTQTPAVARLSASLVAAVAARQTAGY